MSYGPYTHAFISRCTNNAPGRYYGWRGAAEDGPVPIALQPSRLPLSCPPPSSCVGSGHVGGAGVGCSRANGKLECLAVGSWTLEPKTISDGRGKKEQGQVSLVLRWSCPMASGLWGFLHFAARHVLRHQEWSVGPSLCSHFKCCYSQRDFVPWNSTARYWQRTLLFSSSF